MMGGRISEKRVKTFQRTALCRRSLGRQNNEVVPGPFGRCCPRDGVATAWAGNREEEVASKSLRTRMASASRRFCLSLGGFFLCAYASQASLF